MGQHTSKAAKSKTEREFEALRKSIDDEYARQEAEANAKAEAKERAAREADAEPLSAEAKAVIARMTHRMHIHMSWAEPYVRDKDDILEAVRRQAPGATGFLIRTVPDADGFATVEPSYEYKEFGSGSRWSHPRTQTPAERRAAEAARKKRASKEPQSLRIRIIKNRKEEKE